MYAYICLLYPNFFLILSLFTCLFPHSFSYSSVLQRGEKLEDLVERSGELSAQSKLFYKQAKRANSCCVVI